MGLEFFDKAKEVSELLEKEEASNITEAARMVSKSIMAGGIIQAFGSGHSYAAAIELCGRAGGFITSKVINDPAMGYYEQYEGVGTHLAHKVKLDPEDIVFIISNSGRNPMAIELAQWVKSKGNPLVVITSKKVSEAGTSRHSSGKKLYEFADVILDNHSVYGDSALELKNPDIKLCGTSSFAAVLLAQQSVFEAARDMEEKGFVPPIYRSANIDGGPEFNEALEEKYSEQIFHI